MFKKYIPEDSRTHKQLAIIQQAKQYHEMEVDTSSDEWEEFAIELEEHLEKELNENSDTKAALDKVIFEYSKNVERSRDFINFSSYLKDKYTKGFPQMK